MDKKTADSNGVNHLETSEEDDDADDMVGRDREYIYIYIYMPIQQSTSTKSPS